MTSCRCCLLGLKPGTECSITQIGNMDPILKRRLADLGILEGTSITVKRYCLWGGPVTLECGGQLLGIRQKEAAHIEVAVS
ncbi:FeoA family protein [Paenibacillus macerans]|uniref:FeoA family protein n=1 Tax=Paenibacillus macerans TaxID=44252 RepID=UPI003D3150A8